MTARLIAADHPEATGLVLVGDVGERARIAWVGPTRPGLNADEVAAAVGAAGAAATVTEVAGRALPLVPQASDAWAGRPGLAGHRIGAVRRDWFADFLTTTIVANADRTTIGTITDRVTIDAVDEVAQLGLRTEIELLAGGALRMRHTLANRGCVPFQVEWLDVVLPVPDRVAEMLDCTGRWGRERTPQRRAIADGQWLREGRTGKTGPDAPTLLVAGTSGFGFQSGEVWGVHVGWSGNTRYLLERRPCGVITIGGGELLLPGEVVLAEGEPYRTPWVYVTAARDGLDALAAALHRYERSLPAHPARPKPVTCNTWEAVYFDQTLDKLVELAERAARVGAERFVLDDGWFGSRRDDSAGLGDWTVSPDVWPEGLGPLVERVLALGLQFGIWFEPEMVNADSDLYRAHPEWVLAPADRDPLVFRHQLVLDLGRPEVREYLLEQLSDILTRYPISYVKWDHNRDLIDGAAGPGGPGVHEQTLGYYALLDALRDRHPDVEWESCAAGGARIDLGVLERVQRMWTSDMTDALARQGIQRWTAQLVAPEYLGAHVSAPVNHQTHRVLPLDFRVATAFFGDLGVEWDLTAASDDELDRLTEWIAAYKQHRPLLHSGRMVRVDSPADAIWMHGVVAADRSQGLFGYVQLDERVADPVPFTIPGLDPLRRYRVSRLLPGQTAWAVDGLVLSGAVLADIGLAAPPRAPLSVELVHLRGQTG